MRSFALHREVDETGVSGTGIVAQGVEFDDGRCAMRWLTATASTACYDSTADVEAIHGHNGSTVIVWDVDPDRFERVEAYHDVMCPLFIWEHDPDLFNDKPGCNCEPVYRLVEAQS